MARHPAGSTTKEQPRRRTQRIAGRLFRLGHRGDEAAIRGGMLCEGAVRGRSREITRLRPLQRAGIV